MGLERTGARTSITARSAVTVDDTAWPSGLAPSGSVAVPANAKGAVTHVTAESTGTGTGVAFRCDVLGLIGSTWYTVAPLNSSTALARTTNVGVANANNIQYAEAFAHIAFFDRLYPIISGIAGGASVTVTFHFEKP